VNHDYLILSNIQIHVASQFILNTLLLKLEALKGKLGIHQHSTVLQNANLEVSIDPPKEEYQHRTNGDTMTTMVPFESGLEKLQEDVDILKRGLDRFKSVDPVTIGLDPLNSSVISLKRRLKGVPILRHRKLLTP
jgi:hypothetical protein